MYDQILKNQFYQKQIKQIQQTVKKMSINISKRRSSSVVPAVGAFNNWINVHERKVPSSKIKQTRFMSSSFYRSTLPVNPQNSAFFQSEEQPRHIRTYSSFRNTQSRLNVTRDQLMEMSSQISYMTERVKKTRLDMKIMQKQVTFDLEQKQQQLRQKIIGLKKIVKSAAKDNETRGFSIKNQISSLKDNYQLMKQKVDWMDERLSVIQSQCGFTSLKSKLLI